MSIFGSQQFAVRIQMHPDALTARGISVDALKTAVAAANDNSPLGTARTKDRQVAIVADTQRMNAANFSNIIIKSDNGKPVRLGDVATVIDPIANDQTASWHDGSRAIILAILRQPDANTVQVVDRVQALLPSLRQSLPAAASIETLNDRSVSVRGAVHDVQFTLALTVGLVILVIFVFVRRLWATLIPALAVPISIIATFAAMYPLGFSIDNISLMALTLSVGLVVDDAIVMLENIVRHMEEEGSDAFSAALAGSKEIGFTIVAISLSLVAVFIPVLLMGGVIGRILHEFAVVVTVAILASAFVSLTLTPMLAARLPANSESAGGGVLTRLDLAFERGFARILKTYEGLLSFCIRQRAWYFFSSCSPWRSPPTRLFRSRRASFLRRISASSRSPPGPVRTFPLLRCLRFSPRSKRSLPSRPTSPMSQARSDRAGHRRPSTPGAFSWNSNRSATARRSKPFLRNCAGSLRQFPASRRSCRRSRTSPSGRAPPPASISWCSRASISR